MIKIGVEIKKYKDQLGAFVTKKIKKGSIIFIYTDPSHAMTIKETDLIQLLKEKDQRAILTGCRFIYDEFIMDEILPEKLPKSYYINHSFKPNVLYHCGIGFALRDIEKDEMLTVNYEYLLSETDFENFIDWETGKVVKGLSGLESLTRSTEELLRLLWSLDD